MEIPKLEPVESSTIVAIGYIEEKELLFIQFKTSMYVYKKVPKFMYVQFSLNSSKGTYFHKNIKDKFESERIS
jgi:hypothetical protein